MLVPNFLVRGFVEAFKAATTVEWEAAERRWREWESGKKEEQQREFGGV
jgi:hypothetical protein